MSQADSPKQSTAKLEEMRALLADANTPADILQKIAQQIMAQVLQRFEDSIASTDEDNVDGLQIFWQPSHLEKQPTTTEQKLLEAIARHPNAALELLVNLAEYAPAAILENPSLPLLRLAYPNLLHEFELADIYELLAIANVPKWLVSQALSHPDEDVRLAALTSLENTVFSQQQLEQLLSDDSWRVREELAKRKELAEQALEVLSQDEDYDVRRAVAQHPKLSASQLAKLLTDDYDIVRASLALRPDLSLSAIKQLLSADDETVLTALARRPDLPISICQQLFDSNYPEVVVACLSRVKIPTQWIIEVLAPYAGHSAMAKAALCERPELSDQQLIQLANETSEEIHSALLERPELPQAAILALCDAADENIRQQLSQVETLSRAVIQKLLDDSNIVVRITLALRPDLTPADLQQLAQDQASEVRTTLAHASNSLPNQVMELLATDTVLAVRRALAGRHDLSPQAEQILSQDEDELIQLLLKESKSMVS